MRILLVSLLVVSVSAARTEPSYKLFPLRLDGPVDKLAAADLDGDGLDDLVLARGARLDIYFQDRAKGFDMRIPGASLRLPGVSIGWHTAALAGGRAEVVALVDSREVKAWAIEAKTRKFTAPRVVLSGAQAFLPRGCHYLPFSTDVDGDGGLDLLVPGTSRFRVFLRRADGSYGVGFDVQAEVQLRWSGRGDGDLNARLGQSVVIPRLGLRDVNGDGRRDLISETSDRLEVFLAAAGERGARTPAYVVDLAAARERVGEIDPDEIDFSNLSAAMSRTVQAVMEDLDGDGVEDVLLREGGRILVYRADKSGLNASKPAQVLKAGENVFFAHLRDEDGDGRLDLWLVRIEPISIGDVFLWLAASGSVDFEVFIYRNEGRRFSRRPSRKLTLTLRFPSLVSLPDLGRKLEAKKEEAAKVVVKALDATGRGEQLDLALLRDDTLKLYLQRGDLVEEMSDVLSLFDYRRDRDDYDIELESLLDSALFRSQALAAKLDGAPQVNVALRDGSWPRAMYVRDYNGDGREDLLLLHGESATGLRGAMVLSR